ncbi:hypothetical protein AWB75_00650 [Caballeronia catudaia]|uniref:Uncharacterized protein n=1 Tax=Caballeronia catudaia TaxID=1777136 RepID=A0A157ZET1_9BURK|nr:hypothetical protein [Caballeronia catudaia]SAK44082.1 hypothetical protein AWB75_00650 [Caballeronia catudaia]
MTDVKQEVYALVTTTRALLLIELSSKRVSPLEWDRGEYYGVSWFPRSEHLVLTHSLVNNAELLDLTAYAQSEVGILSIGDRQTQGFLSQPHQIVCGSDGRVICTNTGRNAISVLDVARPDIVQEARISSARWDRLDPQHVIGDHLNSVFEKDGRLYVIAHGHGNGSALAIFSYPDMNVLSVEPVKNRTGLHNIWVTSEGQRIACHSESGSLIELNSDAVLWESGCPIYTRGLAATPDFVLVGESEKSSRELRRATMSGLWMLDRKTWQPIDFFQLGPYGGVHDVRLLNVSDDAHHGHVFAGTEALLARDRDKERVEGRIRASKRLQRSREVWKEFNVIFGTPKVGADEALRVDQDHLCLMTRNGTDSNVPSEFGFEYALNAEEPGGHVSVVAYRGMGFDTNMVAVLIQGANEREGIVSRWVHDGQRWDVQSLEPLSGMPLGGRVRVVRSEDRVQVLIEGRAIPDEFLEGMDGQLGIRWSGAALLPTD